MPNPDLYELMKRYAAVGFEDWNATNGATRKRAQVCLQYQILESEHHITRTPAKFLPMPKLRGKGIDFGFFMPRTINYHGHEKLAFDLFLLVSGSKNLAFRFEPADNPNRSHNYAHIQFCRKFRRGHSEFKPIGLPQWLPDSYPAFPLPSSEPLDLFLFMATALHGRRGGIDAILKEIFQKAGRTLKAVEYLELLDKKLDTCIISRPTE